MQQYIGTKIINAKPMNRLEYNQFRGWELPADENGADEVFLVEYVDGGQANTSEFAGYISWSPSEVFENAYKSSGNLSIGDAIVYLGKGYTVTRKIWKEQNLYLRQIEIDGVTSIVLIAKDDNHMQVFHAQHHDLIANDYVINF
ncbi:MW1434 family type I TA system toxin [Sulfuricurvum sp.]|uniref:Thoeris anti-defense Tad2 family protein n=1 Tax=Sulfuricurvum sp. TaxID=2025608 RepID=UPI00260C9756|nr:MW1434 family type I TA system toxin [Sulfuricurvum sp.]MDD2267226.1 DUF2829 domain-containing protein [Sulfuricurvum sp.]MDD2782850.1 DUF2829 domain-containing protein [Sulfuricurvum sp.]